jgi:propionyl-CoA synthetase
MAYSDIYAKWTADPEGYWLDAAGAIDWAVKPKTALNASRAPFYEWFTDAMGNTCWNAVDRHVLAGRGKQAAIIHDSPVTGTKHVITYAELQERVARLAGALRAKGVEKGDRVIIYMPMVPEALEAMLACARLGAIHSVVFGGFAANELAVRIDDCTPKAIIAASCGIEPNRVVHYKPLLDAAIDMADHKPDFCVILQREQEVAQAGRGPRRGLAQFPVRGGTGRLRGGRGQPSGLYPVYLGTTGAPKGVVRPTAGHLVALMWTMRAIYNVGAGDVFWAASDVGWVVGHSYICYGPLIWRAAPPWSTRASRWARPMPAPSGG